MVTLPTRPGVTQSFLIVGMEGRKPQAAALLFVGGGGNIRLRIEDGEIRFRTLNVLPRARAEFVRNAIPAGACRQSERPEVRRRDDPGFP